MQKIRIDFDNPGLPQHISAVENDSQSRFFQATLYENGKAYTAPEGAAYSIMYRGFGPQNQGWYDTINDGAGKRAACAVSGNVVTCEIARQALQVPGHVSIVLCVTTGKGYMLKSWPIECDCKNDRYDSTTEIESFFYVTNVSNASWMQAIQAVEELKNTIDPTLSLSGKAADAAKVGEAVGEIKEDLVNIKPISTCDTNFIESVHNHVKGLESTNQGYWGDYGDSSTLPEMSFVDAPNSSILAIKPIELKAGVTYKTTNARVYLSYIYDKVTRVYTRYYQVTTWKTKVATMTITPVNDSILYMSVVASDYENTMVVNGNVPTEYHKYGEPISNSVIIPNLDKDSIIKHNIITVKKDGSGDFTKVYDAVNSITDSDKYNIYDIHIYEGVYDVIDEVFGSESYYTTEGIILPPYVNLIGIGQRDKIILTAEFPDTVSTAVSTAFSTINVDGSNDLENITFIAYNCRYACHDDDGNAEKSRNFIRNVKNCRFWHKGCYTDDGSVWKWCKAYAQGLSSGSESKYEYCEFRTDVNIEGNCAWSTHGQENLEKPSYITHKHCKFINTNFDLCATANGLNDHVEEYVTFIGCEFTRSVGTGNNVEINKEQYTSDGVYFNAYGIANKNCYAGVGIYASGMSGKLHFFANDNN